MKLKLLLVTLTVGFFAIALALVLQKTSTRLPVSPISRGVSPSPSMSSKDITYSLFVPYWTLSSGEAEEKFTTLIYFGITPTLTGINTAESGYRNLDAFHQLAAGRRKLLTLRMVDSTQNFRILENQKAQQSIIRETVALAKEQGFDGIILDLEVSALPFDSLIQQISSFHKALHTASKKENLHYGIALYGDTFYRIRPFDVPTIAKYTDEVLIMAYDFHKARGNPGPNFPLSGEKKYGSDYREMTETFLNYLPPEKITVIFGYFGYDWTVDAKGNSLSRGEALSLNQITARYISSCSGMDCVRKRDEHSAESSVTYTDDEGKKHVVWFEDEESVRRKQEYLKTLGIT